MKEVVRAAQKIRKKGHQKVLIAAGAGIGKDSGMPDFRGIEGFWNNYPPFRNKFDFYQCANPEFLKEQPHYFWGFYGHRLEMYRKITPHSGFQILQSISQKNFQNYFIYTSNVDGHFSNFFPQSKIYEVHGSIHHLQCFHCHQIYPNNFEPKVDLQTMKCQNLPICPSCMNMVRPNILMFNDWEWVSDRSDNQAHRFRRFIQNQDEKNSQFVIIEIGCGTAVPTVRNTCEQLFYSIKNSILIRINPDQDASSKIWNKNERFIHIKKGALQALQAIEKELKVYT